MRQMWVRIHVDRCIYLVVVIAAVLNAGNVYAQFKMPVRMPPAALSADEIVGRMQRELGLSDEQVAQVRPVIEDELEQMKTFKDPDVDRNRDGFVDHSDVDDEGMDAARKKTTSRLSQYLTPEQMAVWEEQQDYFRGEVEREIPDIRTRISDY